MRLVECVPNISEGRRKVVIEDVVNAVKASGVKILDVESDPSHNRSVITFVGTAKQVKDALLKLGERAIEHIDLNKHRGEHPRMGAVDVIPFVPLGDTTMQECVMLAREFAKEYAEKLKVPVYLYEEAARRADRRDLAKVREGEFERLREELGKNPEKNPDFGPTHVHPTAGATAIGARMPLIAFNVNLDTTELRIAKRIARKIRASSGGLPAVKALGFRVKERNLVQVSMNLTNYNLTPIWKVFEEIKKEAHKEGVGIVGCEIVGLIPLDALVGVANHFLKLKNFTSNQILEKRIT